MGIFFSRAKEKGVGIFMWRISLTVFLSHPSTLSPSCGEMGGRMFIGGGLELYAVFGRAKGFGGGGKKTVNDIPHVKTGFCG